MGTTGPGHAGQDRPRGILSKADRQYLRGKKSYSSEQSERDARYRIRERIKNSILDFTLLINHLDDRDREQIFASSKPDVLSEETELNEQHLTNVVEGAMFLHGIEDAITFFYLGLGDIHQSFEPVLEKSVENAEKKKGMDVEHVLVEIEIQERNPDLTDLIERFESGEAVTEEELKQLIHSNEINLDPTTLDRIFEHIMPNVEQPELEEFTDESEENGDTEN